MKRVLFTMLLCAVGPTPASAQNEISQQLLELDPDQRNAAFTRMLWDTKRKCDHVIRTLFNGTVLGVDDWEVLCRDRRSYSLSVLVELEPHDTIITSLSCRELSATSKMLLHKAGDPPDQHFIGGSPNGLGYYGAFTMHRRRVPQGVSSRPTSRRSAPPRAKRGPRTLQINGAAFR